MLDAGVVCQPGSALARAIAEIREVRSRELHHRMRRRDPREALRLADRLLNDLEELQLRGRVHVPAAWRRSVERLQRAATQVGISSTHQTLETRLGIIRLMDDIFELEEKLMRRYRSDWRVSAYRQ
jgi:hypothetical protein